MRVWELVYQDTSWIDAGFGQAGKSWALNCSLLSSRALLRDKLRRAQVELGQQLPPMPGTVEATGPEMGIFSSIQFSGETSVQTPYFLPVASEAVEEWQRWWQLFRIRNERLRETVRLLRQRSRLLNLAISLLLEMLTCPSFLYQLVRRERAWCLLHGSHPPRQNAGICRPAFAEPGRVGCTRVC